MCFSHKQGMLIMRRAMMDRARGRWLNVTKHAQQGMWQERPPVSIEDLARLFEEPDHDDGKETREVIGKWTIRAYYVSDDEAITVLAVSRSGRR